MIYKAIYNARAKWRRIGMELGLSTGDLDAISCRHSNPEDQLERALFIWVNKGKGTWAQLVEALYSKTVGEAVLAQIIAEEHGCKG